MGKKSKEHVASWDFEKALYDLEAFSLIATFCGMSIGYVTNHNQTSKYDYGLARYLSDARAACERIKTDLGDRLVKIGGNGNEQ